MEYFNQSIQQHFGRLSEDELEIVRSYFKREKLKKNDFFTKADKICDKLSLVKSGIMRVFALSDGKEITHWLCTENFIFTDVMGFFFDEPNRWNVQALTDVELFTVKKSDYRKLCDEFPKWNEIEKRFIIKCFAMTEDRVFSHLSMTAEERYDLYFEQHKELFNQVPLQYIASVLGMTAETFSRIRKRQAESS
ncbi:cyclic nucleotide-binding protein [Elizabethkingia anophelis]|jgi:CRP/FNR family transcriptional regulator, anaerobic regulatory protein|nr:cyclic nucleotide-binding protein [Elizabethkingia anophelis]MDV4086334.1 cyclic nucleotide-binding protein [Elizabethkingia anophelis]